MGPHTAAVPVVSQAAYRRGGAINHSLQIIAGLWNLKTHNQLRVNS